MLWNFAFCVLGAAIAFFGLILGLALGGPNKPKKDREVATWSGQREVSGFNRDGDPL